MPDDSNASYNAALQVIRQAAIDLIQWASEESSDQAFKPLQLVFDQVHLTHGQSNPSNYRPTWSLRIEDNENTPRIPYPQSKTQAEAGLNALKREINQAVKDLNWQDLSNCHNLAQMTLFLEKFGSHLSFEEPDISLVDQAKSDAAIAAALAQNSRDETLALVGGDLMGVQKFIYTISSEGALKSLRARSFYLELVTEEVVQQILTALDLPRTNVIYAGASKFYLLVAKTEQLEATLQQIQETFNNWLLDTFQRKVFLAIAYVPFLANQLEAVLRHGQTSTPLTEIWQQVNDKLTVQASRKFEHQLDKILNPQPSHQPCKVCHRDNSNKLTRLNRDDPGSVEACTTCARMFRLGRQLLRVNAIVRSSRRNLAPTRLRFNLQSGTIYHYLFENLSAALQIAEENDVVFLVNDWNIDHYETSQVTPLLYANYGQLSAEEFLDNDQNRPSTMQAEEFAQKSEGIKRVGYLRMDVDRLSQIFSKGLGAAYTLPRLASLSRQMTYFFKVYLNSLAAHRTANLPSRYQALMLEANQPHPRLNLLFIYAGGDDLFISGAWNEVIEFAFDVYQSFRAYTGNHPDITLSGGISLDDAKYPLYKAATDAGRAEDDAKADGRDSLGLFGEVFKWGEWLGVAGLTTLSPEIQEYLKPEIMPSLLGVLPFVERLDQQLEVNQSRSFVRNLLATAQAQTQMLERIKDQKSREARDIRYFLHLPKIAYTIARLPSRVRDDPNFDPIRISLKSPYNAPYFRAIATWIELLNR